MRFNPRNVLIWCCTFFGGLYFFLEFVTPEFLLPKTVFGVDFATFDAQISQSTILVSAMAVGLGIINLFRVHGAKIVRGRSGWINSAALLLGLFVAFGIELTDFLNAESRINSIDRFRAINLYVTRETESLSNEKRTNIKRFIGEISSDTKNVDGNLYNAESNNLAQQLEQLSQLVETADSTAIIAAVEKVEKLAKEQSDANYENSRAKLSSNFIFNAIFTPLGSAMFSLLAFYVATAAYRAFRIRSVEAGIMMLAAVIVMLGQIPHGPLYVSQHLPDIRNWLLLNISTPAFRAIFFGASIAGLAMTIRMWFSLERSPLSSEGESS